jgi:hypothetical protein
MCREYSGMTPTYDDLYGRDETIKTFHCSGFGGEFERPFVQFCQPLSGRDNVYFSNDFLREETEEGFLDTYKSSKGSPLHRWFLEAKEAAQHAQ